MVELQINTTQNVTINFTAATIGERILAWLIDGIVKIAYLIVVYLLVFDFFEIQKAIMFMDQWSQMAIMAMFYLPVVFYTLVFETLLDGQTLGKRILKIKVVKIDGYQASLSDFLIRWFFRIIDIDLMSGVVALVSIGSSKKSQRLGDITAGTSVITLKNKVNISHTILENLEGDYIPTYPNIIKLSDNDARIIKDAFLAAKASNDHETLFKLRTKIIEVVGIKKVKQKTAAEFIDVVLKDYNYYTQNM